MNVASVDYFSNEYTFMNLLTGHTWVDTGTGWQAVPESEIDSLGMIKQMAAGKSDARVMTPPVAGFNGQVVGVRCTWTGTGDVNIRRIPEEPGARRPCPDVRLDGRARAGR